MYGSQSLGAALLYSQHLAGDKDPYPALAKKHPGLAQTHKNMLGSGWVGAQVLAAVVKREKKEKDTVTIELKKQQTVAEREEKKKKTAETKRKRDQVKGKSEAVEPRKKRLRNAGESSSSRG